MRASDADDFTDPFKAAPLFRMSTGISFTPHEVEIYYAVRVPNLKPARFGERRGPCPLHNGKDDNFAVDPETGQWYCHSICNRGGDILAIEQALTAADFKRAKEEVFRIVGRLEPSNGSHGQRRAGARIVVACDYTDESDTLLYQVVRFEPKSFKQRRPDGNGGWIWNIEGVRLVLYRLPELLKRQTETVFLCEGEKDVHSLEALGLLATCNPMGAGKWRPEYSEILRGRSVVILPDNDTPGRKHSVTVVTSLLNVKASVRIVELPGLPAKGDVTDWLEAGNTLDQLRELTEGAAYLDVAALSDLQTRWGIADEKPKRQISSTPFRLTDEGVFYIDPDPDKESIKVCGRLEVAALTRDGQGDCWGRLLKWPDAEDRMHVWAMPMSLLAGDGNEYRARLLDGGLIISAGRKVRDLLTTYIQTTYVEARTLCVSRVGWHSDTFVLPATANGPTAAESIILQTPFDADHLLNAAGSLEDWKANVGRFCSGNSRLIFCVSAAFAGPLLALAGAESGGVHFVGRTSTGKSTMLYAGGSVVGGGALSGFVQSWRTTANGLEATADFHNDLTLFLDELSQLDAREAADVAYLLANGRGKSRMSRSIGLRKRSTWRLLFLSAGEITLSEHAQTAGRRVRAGAEIRLLNIDADAGAQMGVFENIYDAESPAEFALRLKRASLSFYGTPLRAFLEFLTKNRSAVEKALKNFQADFLKNHVSSGASGEVFRAAQRFALIAAAGELATDAGITGWLSGEATDAAVRCMNSWVSQRGTTGSADAQAALNQVRRFLEANGASRFQVIRYGANSGASDNQDELEVVRDRVGFRRRNAESNETEYLILQESFKSEVCAGYDHRLVREELEAKNFLVRERPHWTIKPRHLPEVPSGARVYCIRGAILEGAE